MTKKQNPRFSNRTLDYFLVLVDTMNYTKAAQKLGISQPALSQQIRKLERKVGAPLFWTNKKQLCLTKEGETVLRMVHGIYTITEQAAEELAQATGTVPGNIHIGTLDSYEDTFLVDFLAHFHEKTPETVLILHKLSRKELWHQLERNELDVALMYLPDQTITNWTAYDNRLIVKDELLFFDPKKTWAECESVSLEEAVCQPWAVYPETYYFHQCAEEAFARNMVTPPRVAAFLPTSHQLLRFSTQTGHPTVLPRSYIESCPGEVEKNAVSFSEPIEFQQAFVYRKDKLLIPRIKVFLDSFEDYLFSHSHLVSLNGQRALRNS